MQGDINKLFVKVQNYIYPLSSDVELPADLSTTSSTTSSSTSSSSSSSTTSSYLSSVTWASPSLLVVSHLPSRFHFEEKNGIKDACGTVNVTVYTLM